MWKRLREWWLSRGQAAEVETLAAPAPDPPAPDPELIEKFAEKAHDLDAQKKPSKTRPPSARDFG